MSENIHTAIAAVYGKVGYVQKERKAGLNYTFAGEAALIEALRPFMVEQGIYVCVVGVNDVVRSETPRANGGVMTTTRAVYTVRFAHAPSDTHIDVMALGEGADVGDKSSPKAATSAYKYALRQTFCIETGDDPDAFASEQAAGAKTPAPAQNGTQSRPAAPPAASVPVWWAQFTAKAQEVELAAADIAAYLRCEPTDAAIIENVKAWVSQESGRKVTDVLRFAVTHKGEKAVKAGG